ncbi:MAG: hypothetical protein ACYDAR_19505 [Thermomicrobiales bacterium]
MESLGLWASRHRYFGGGEMDPNVAIIILGIIIFAVGLAYIARQTP